MKKIFFITIIFSCLCVMSQNTRMGLYISPAILQFHTCHLIFTHETPLLHSIHDIIHGKGGNMN